VWWIVNRFPEMIYFLKSEFSYGTRTIKVEGKKIREGRRKKGNNKEMK
jgi:hypothetical protein